MSGRPSVYEFHGFRLDAGQRRLFSGATPVDLTSRVFDTLLHFVEHRGELLSKAALMKAVWPDSVVEENNLNQAISALRKALGEKKGEHRFIVTDPGRGYRFVPEVKVVAADEVRPEQPMAAPARSELSIAVLPFVNMSSDPEQEYFSDGIAEELLTQLSKLPELRVAGRTSAFYFKGKNEDFRVIGEKLNVDHLLEGSVRKAGSRVRIAVQLIKATDGYQLWSERYDRELDDIFAIQDDIAKAVTSALAVTLGVGDIAGRTRNIEAYDAFLAGRALFHRWGRENVLRAIEKMEQAVALDPEFAIAWSGLSAVCIDAAEVFLPEREQELVERSRLAATRALEIAPEGIESLAANIGLHVQNREWSSAEDLCAKAFQLAPASDSWINVPWGHFLWNVGRAREAVAAFERAVRVEPLASATHLSLGLAHEYAGDPHAALAAFKRARELSDQFGALDSFALVVAMELDDRALIDEQIARVVGSDLLPANVAGGGTRDLNQVMHSLLDSPAAAVDELHQFLEDPAYQDIVSRVGIAVWAAYFGEHELSLDMYRRVHESSSFPPHALWRPILRDMRQLSGFKDLLRDVGLVDYWRESGNWGDFCRPVGSDDFECV